MSASTPYVSPILNEVDKPNTFYNAILKAKHDDKDFGDYVDDHSAIDYRDMKLFLTDNSDAGVAIEKDGNINSVFKNKNSKRKGVVDDLLQTARDNGGDRLDCYGDGLVNMYSRNGFEPVARIPFNPEYTTSEQLLKNKPDVYVMKRTSQSTKSVQSAIKRDSYKKWTPEELSKLPTFTGETGYDDALRYRDSLIK